MRIEGFGEGGVCNRDSAAAWQSRGSRAYRLNLLSLPLPSLPLRYYSSYYTSLYFYLYSCFYSYLCSWTLVWRMSEPLQHCKRYTQTIRRIHATEQTFTSAMTSRLHTDSHPAAASGDYMPSSYHSIANLDDGMSRRCCSKTAGSNIMLTLRL